MSVLALALLLLAASPAPAAAGRVLRSAAAAGPLVAELLAKKGGVPAHFYAALEGTKQKGWAVERLKPLGQVTSCGAAEGKALCDGDPTCEGGDGRSVAAWTTNAPDTPGPQSPAAGSSTRRTSAAT